MYLPAIMQPCWPPVLDKAQATECRSYEYNRSASRDGLPANNVDASLGLHTSGCADTRASGLPFLASSISFISLTMSATFHSLG